MTFACALTHLTSERVCGMGRLLLNTDSSAANYLNNMNADVRPCDDFYEFACGRYSNSKVRGAVGWCDFRKVSCSKK